MRHRLSKPRPSDGDTAHRQLSSRARATSTNNSTSKRRGDNLNRFEDFNVEAKARIWRWLFHMTVRPTRREHRPRNPAKGTEKSKTHSLTLTLSLSQSLTPSLSLSRRGCRNRWMRWRPCLRSLPLSLTHTHTRVYSLPHKRTHTISLTHSLTHSLSLYWMRLQPCR